MCFTLDYSSDEIDEELKCSLCHEKFTDVVKLLPGCGESICGRCYEELRGARELECRVCRQVHTMPAGGLVDCKGLARMLKRRRIARPLREDARVLRDRFATAPLTLTRLKSRLGRSFDAARRLGRA